MPSEVLIDSPAAEAGDRWLKREQLAMQPMGAVDDFGTSEVLCPDCRAAAEVREPNAGLAWQQSVIEGAHRTPGKPGLAQVPPELIAGARVVVARFG